MFIIPKTKKELNRILMNNGVDIKYLNQYWLAAQMARQWIKDNPEPKGINDDNIGN